MKTVGVIAVVVAVVLLAAGWAMANYGELAALVVAAAVVVLAALVAREVEDRKRNGEAPLFRRKRDDSHRS